MGFPRKLLAIFVKGFGLLKGLIKISNMIGIIIALQGLSVDSVFDILFIYDFIHVGSYIHILTRCLRFFDVLATRLLKAGPPDMFIFSALHFLRLHFGFAKLARGTLRGGLLDLLGFNLHLKPANLLSHLKNLLLLIDNDLFVFLILHLQNFRFTLLPGKFLK